MTMYLLVGFFVVASLDFRPGPTIYDYVCYVARKPPHIVESESTEILILLVIVWIVLVICWPVVLIRIFMGRD